MSGWRDADGRTANERKQVRSAEDRARLADTARRRPLSLVKPLLGAAFVVLLIVALLLAFR